MSLLLDALKKAAEQKAEKSRQEETPAASPSDETEIVAAAEDVSMLAQGAGHGSPRSERDNEDETELDTSEVRTRLERTLIEREEGDDTQLEIPDSTQTRTPSLSSQMQSGEDETIILAEEDVADFLGEPELVNREPQDETELSQVAPQQDVAEPADKVAREDDTDISQPFQPGTTPEIQAHTDSGDETDISQPFPPGDASEIPSGAVVENAFDDEDLSLLLVERDDTNLTGRTSVTDQQTPQEITQVLESDDADSDGLALVDKTQHRVPDDIAETLAPTQAGSTGIATETQATQGATTRMDSTSTRTYAPDNYDRTLVRLPSDDASKIFAGMRSDSDVVMTPDYAKKVFRSKSSAQRLQAYKVYVGIAIVILLSTVIYGAFEFQSESNNIDFSLRPLKNDPMPGIIKAEEIKQDSDLFAGSGTNARTIGIIESADNAGEIVAADEDVIADEAEIADQAMATEDVAIEATTVEADSAAVISASAAAVQTESVETTRNASITQAEVAAIQSESSSSTLEIISSTGVRQKDLWLREAYDAYKSGNDSLATTRYNQVLEIDPRNRNALLARAAINVQNNNGNAAIKDYQTLLLHNPKDSLAMTSLITVANYSPLETESQLKLMIRDEPNSAYLNFALANAYGAQNRWQEAQGYYFKALENNPGDPNYAYNLAVSLEHIAQPVAAVAYYQRALDNIDNGLATFSREVVSQRMETLAK
jgi:tetratricopeptide (TPR) repeat protein